MQRLNMTRLNTERLNKTLILLLVAGIPAAAAPPLFLSFSAQQQPQLCFTAGSITYQVGGAAPDYRVRIAAAAGDLHIQLVNDVNLADFALVDDVADADTACDAGGTVRTIKVVDDASPADVTVSLTQAVAQADTREVEETTAEAAVAEPAGADLKLFVNSARFDHRDAAALLAAMRHYQAGQLAQSR
jgi:hypothetical protein